MKSIKHEEKWFWVSNMEISKTSQKLHFRVTKKDPCLPFNFQILNLFKSLWNLGFDQDSNGHKNSGKNQKIDKPKHIAFLCHIVSIQVDKQGLDIFKPEKSCIYLPLTLNSVLWRSQAWREVVLGFKHRNFKKKTESFILGRLRRIHAYHFIFMF